jgi:hypothetical protein
MESSSAIRMIDNREKRLDILRPLLDFLVHNKQAKNDNNLYIVRANLLSDPNKSIPERLFYSLQMNSAHKGFVFNCYNFKDA